MLPTCFLPRKPCHPFSRVSTSGSTPITVFKPLRPTDARCRSGNRVHATCAGHFAHSVHAKPARSGDVKRAAVWASQHTGEPAATKRHLVQYLAAFADAAAVGVGYVGVPDRSTCIDADAVGRPAQIGPDAAAGQSAVGSDVEGAEPPGVGLSTDQRTIVGRHTHTARKGE